MAVWTRGLSFKIFYFEISWCEVFHVDEHKLFESSCIFFLECIDSIQRELKKTLYIQIKIFTLSHSIIVKFDKIY